MSRVDGEYVSDDWWQCDCGFDNPPQFDTCLRCQTDSIAPDAR